MGDFQWEPPEWARVVATGIGAVHDRLREPTIEERNQTQLRAVRGAKLQRPSKGRLQWGAK